MKGVLKVDKLNQKKKSKKTSADLKYENATGVTSNQEFSTELSPDDFKMDSSKKSKNK